MRNLNNVIMDGSNVASLLFTLKSAEAGNSPNQSQRACLRYWAGKAFCVAWRAAQQGAVASFLSVSVMLLTEVQQIHRKVPQS